MCAALEGLSTRELEDIIEKDGKAEGLCHFCNKKYVFDKQELEDILKSNTKT